MVTTLQFGIALTLISFAILLVVTYHGKYVTEKIAAGEYNKGPLRDSDGDEDE